VCRGIALSNYHQDYRWKRLNLTEHDAVVDSEIVPALTKAVREAWTTFKKASSLRNVSPEWLELRLPPQAELEPPSFRLTTNPS
jgi:hypothetical protein